MKFTCNTNNLRKVISLVEHNTVRKISLPILSSILLTVEKGRLTLTTTNLEIATEAWVGAKVFDEGRVAVPAHILSSYLQTVKADQIHINSQKEHLVLTTPERRIIIKGYPVEDFPLVPKVQEDAHCTLSAGEVYRALSQVIFAAATTSIKPELSSVLFRFLKTSLKVVATDSFRLSETTIPGSFADMQSMQYFLLPIHTASELLRVLDADMRDLEVTVTKGQILFATETFRIVSRLVEGAFPDYERIIPAKFTTRVVLAKSDFQETLRGIGLFTSKLNDVSLKLHPELEELEVTTANADVGEYFSKLKSEMTGEELSLSFNYRYLIEGVQQIKSEKIFLGFSGAHGPVLIKHSDSEEYIYIAMPMKV